MPPQPTKTIDTYLAAQPPKALTALTRVRSALRKALPGAAEVISYGIPAFKVNGRVVIFFAAWKEHYSIYPSGERLVSAFKAQLEPYELDKGTIRFPYSEPVPTTLIQEIAKFRATEAAERRTLKRATPRKAIKRAPTSGTR